MLKVADSGSFSPNRELDYIQPFTAEHWGTMMAMVRDPDGRIVSFQAPVPEGVDTPDPDAHHAEKYGTSAGREQRLVEAAVATPVEPGRRSATEAPNRNNAFR